jgi:RHS repeat-associated protein
MIGRADLQRVTRITSVIVSLSLSALVAQQVSAQEPEGKSGVTPQVIALPTGPGTLDGLGESFQPHLNTGTASYIYDLVVPPAVNGFEPQLQLDYNGGNASGPVGLGWLLTLPYIQRQIEYGLPSYDESDDFLFHNGETLVAVGENTFRFENEGLFYRFRRSTSDQSDYWEAMLPDGTQLLFGISTVARIEHQHLGIFRWNLERQIDTNGNEIRYLYDSRDGYPYLTEIQYNFTSDGRFNSVTFHYEDRPDVFTDRTSRAPVSISQRAVEVRIHALDELVRIYRFEYEPQSPTVTLSLLKSITVIGSDSISQLPATTFTYTTFDPTRSETVLLPALPAGLLQSSDAELVDANYDALPDVVQVRANEQRYFLNLRQSTWEENTSFLDGVLPLRSDVRLADLDGNGQSDLVVQSNRFFYLHADPGRLWSTKVSFEKTPAVQINDPNVALVDLNHDRRIDILQTGSDNYRIWTLEEDIATGEYNRWEAQPSQPAVDLGGRLSLANPNVYLADMTGDRLQDIVFIRPSDGSVYYAPHNGNGMFADVIEMRGGTQGTTLDSNRYVRFGDVNNDGLADLILPLNESVRYWLNRGSNSFGSAITISNTPRLRTGDTIVRLADMNGDGTNDLLFAQRDGYIAFVDFDAGSQPNLLSQIDNGLGRSIMIDYRPSTDYYLDDRESGNTWTHSLPFPIQLVAKITVHDANSLQNYVTQFQYKNGFYDSEEHEFRGFAEVIKTEYGDDSAPTAITHHFYDVGDTVESRKGLEIGRVLLEIGGNCDRPETGCYEHRRSEISDLQISPGVSFSFVARSTTLLYEKTRQPIQLLQTFLFDNFGNLTQAFDFGRVCPQDDGTLDMACGDDERLQYIEYARNLERWIINGPSIVRQTDFHGKTISERRMYYDGADFVGLPLGQVELGNLTRQEDYVGPEQNNRWVNSIRQAYDHFGNVIGSQDANGNLTTIVYDSLSHTFPIAEHLHLPDYMLSLSATYDYRFGQVQTFTDVAGNLTTFEYDTFGRIHKTIAPGDTSELPTTQYRYELGNPISAITTSHREQSGEAAERRSVAYFDGLGRALQVRREAENNQVIVENAVTFNSRQSEQEQYLPYYDTQLTYSIPSDTHARILLYYDAKGRIVRLVNPDTSSTSQLYLPLMVQQYDEEDNLESSAFYNTPKTLIYDGLGRLTGVEEVNVVNGVSQTYKTMYTYDSLDNLLQIEDNQANITTMQYDGLSRKVYQRHPDAGETTYEYDDNGNLIATIDAKGQRIKYRYDAANRLLQELWLYGEDELRPYSTYHYDRPSDKHRDAVNTHGQLSYVEDQTGTIYFSYDSRGNRTGEIRNFEDEDLEFVTQFNYDASNRLTAVKYPNGATIEYRYNAQGLIHQIPNFVDDIRYTAASQRAAIVFSNDVQTSYRYDDRQRLNHQWTNTSSQTIQDLSYRFDTVGNIVSITDALPNRTVENNQTQEFSYDALYRLTGATGVYGNINYSFDSIGNLIEKTSSSSDTRINLGELHYGEASGGPHALTSFDGLSRQYDANGNVVDSGNTSFTWDHRNQLLTVNDETTVSIYSYDAFGKRSRQLIQQDNGADATLYVSRFTEVRGEHLVQYVLDGNKRIAQFSQPFKTWQLVRGFTNTMTSASPPPENILWYITDHLGGTNILIDKSQQIVSEASYYPYGLMRNILVKQAAPYGFSGKELDATGFHYFGARYYDTLANVWLSVDPRASSTPTLMLENPQSLNTYLFTFGNPIRYQDPDGLVPVETIWDGANVVLGVISLKANIREGNYGAAAVDAVGIFLDTVSTALPYVPGGAGTMIKLGRGAENVHDAMSSSKLLWGTWNDYPKVVVNGQEYAKIGDRLYSHHAVNRMQPSGHRYGAIPGSTDGGSTGGMPQITQPHGTPEGQKLLDYGRSVSPNWVEDIISTTPGVRQSNGNISHTSGSVDVILSPEGRVVTIETH